MTALAGMIALPRWLVTGRALRSVTNAASRCTRQLSRAPLCTQWLGRARLCTLVTQLDALVHLGGFLASWLCRVYLLALYCTVLQKTWWEAICACWLLASRAEGPALRTSASPALPCINARCCTLCRDVALTLQHNLPH